MKLGLNIWLLVTVVFIHRVGWVFTLSIFTIVFLLLILFLFIAINILKEDERGLVFRLGRISGVVGPGLVIIIPIIDKLVRVNLKKRIPEWRGLSKGELQKRIEQVVMSEQEVNISVNASEYLSVRVSEDSICEMYYDKNYDKEIYKIRKRDITSAKLNYGLAADSPKGLVIVGLVSILIGLLPIVSIVFWGKTIEEVAGFLVLCGLTILGVWFIYRALHKEYFLMVHTQTGDWWKFRFKGKADVRKLVDFISYVNNEYGYNISIILPEYTGGMIS